MTRRADEVSTLILVLGGVDVACAKKDCENSERDGNDDCGINKGDAGLFDVNKGATAKQGFDGNGEAAYRGYVQYFINDLGRFEELRAEDFKKSFDSHSPMIDTYRLMLPVWQKIRTTNDAQRKDRLSLEQVKAIVFAPPWKKQPS